MTGVMSSDGLLLDSYAKMSVLLIEWNYTTMSFGKL
jgi:hypothetical protein